MEDFVKFPSIEGFAHVHRNCARLMNPPTVLYRGKIKLHGTNAAVRISARGGRIVAQSRNRDVFVGNDNSGFAAWVSENEDSFLRYPNRVIFGEWAGPGVQKTDAVTMIPKRTFFVFAAIVGGDVVIEPTDLEAVVPACCEVLPWETNIATVAFADHAACSSWADEISEIAEEIGASDPYIRERFGVDGPGEGLVFYPMTAPSPYEFETLSRLLFKVKCEAHRVRKAKKAANVGFKNLEGVAEFVETFVTEQRCEQMLAEIGGVAERERTSDFLKALGGDVKKESGADLEASGLEWKQVAGAVNKAAARWFLARSERVDDMKEAA